MLPSRGTAAIPMRTATSYAAVPPASTPQMLCLELPALTLSRDGVAELPGKPSSCELRLGVLGDAVIRANGLRGLRYEGVPDELSNTSEQYGWRSHSGWGAGGFAQ